MFKNKNPILLKNNFEKITIENRPYFSTNETTPKFDPTKDSP
jgi:hypothetical protein